MVGMVKEILPVFKNLKLYSLQGWNAWAFFAEFKVKIFGNVLHDNLSATIQKRQMLQREKEFMHAEKQQNSLFNRIFEYVQSTLHANVFLLSRNDRHVSRKTRRKTLSGSEKSWLFFMKFRISFQTH